MRRFRRASYWHAVRLRVLHRYLLCFLTVLAVSACSSFQGAPPLPADINAEIGGLASLHNASAIAACINLPVERQTPCRDTIVQSRMIVIDTQYTQFRQGFYGEARWGAFGATLANLAPTTTASLPTVAALTGKALSAAATGVTGARVAFEKDVLVDRTATALETSMDTARNMVALRIRSGLKGDARDYPLAVRCPIWSPTTTPEPCSAHWLALPRSSACRRRRQMPI